MAHVWIVVMSFSIVPAALICLLRYRFILKTYRPFMYLTIVSLLSEIISAVHTYTNGSNVVASNLYVLIEWILLVWLMHNWSANKKRKGVYVYLGILLVLLWLVNTIVLGNIYQFNSLFRICYSFAVVFMAIDHLNALIILERYRLVTNARFLVCCSLIIYFSYKAILEVLYILRLSDSFSFEKVIFLAMAYINLFCNLIYTIASLCLPTKQRLTLPYL